MAQTEADDANEMPNMLGHNSASLQDQMKQLNSELPDYLDAQLAAIFKRAADLKEAFARVPEITNQDIAGKVSDFVAQINACTKEAEARRTDLVAGALTMQRLINGMLDSKVFDFLDTPKGGTGLKQQLSRRLTTWEQQKAEQERLRRLEEERKAKEEAERKRKEAEDAERRAREAADAERRRLAEEERKRQEAEAAERRKREEEERKIREAEEARIAKINNDRQLKAEMAKQEKLRQEREARDAKEAAEREAREEAARQQRERDAARAAEENARREHEAKVAREAADKAEADAAQRAKEAAAKPSELATVRGDYGSSSSLRTVPKGFIKDRAALLADPTIHPFIPEDALEKAVNAYVKTHKMRSKLAGVEVREISDAVVRG